jgi:cytochrome c oxidase assembly protein subunit 15
LNNPRLHRFAVVTAAATFLLLAAGGMVTSRGVGMAVPDWPNTYGYNMFFFPWSQWVGGVFYEHTHRLIASGVGMLTGILALWLYGTAARPFMRWTGLALCILGILNEIVFPGRWADGVVAGAAGLILFGAGFVWPRCEPAGKRLRRLGLIAFFAVVLQGVLGGLRVVLFKDQLGIFHATLAQLFFVLVCALALFTSRWWQERSAGPDARQRVPTRRVPAGFSGLLVATTVLVLLQLIIGATMRHQHAGLAIPDFPLAYGKLWPAADAESVARYNERRIEVTAANPITAFQIELQMAHRVVAALILAGAGVCAWRVRSARSSRSGDERGGDAQRRITVLVWCWLGLILAQAGLGAATVLTNKAADVATAHTLLGALSLALGTMLCILSFPSPDSARRASALPEAAADARAGGPLDARAAAAYES